MKCVVTSDWHLGGMQKVLANPVQSMIHEIHKPFKYAISNGIEHVFVPGDISDTDRLDEYTFIQLVTLLLTYDKHLNTYYIRGNHDIAHKYRTSLDVLQFMSDNKFFKNFKIFKTSELINVEDVPIGMIPYPDKELTTTGRIRAPLLFAHVESPGAVGDNGRPLKCKKDVIRRYTGDFLVSGHIHQYQYLENSRTLYGGTLYQKNFGEKLPKGFLDLNVEHTGRELFVDHEFIPNQPEFTLKTVHIRKSSDWDKILTDSSVRYKVLVDRNSGVVIPKNMLVDHDNIVYLNGVDSKRESGITEIEVKSLKSLPKFNPVYGLNKYLERNGHSIGQIREAQLMVKEAWARLGKQAI